MIDKLSMTIIDCVVEKLGANVYMYHSTCELSILIHSQSSNPKYGLFFIINNKLWYKKVSN